MSTSNIHCHIKVHIFCKYGECGLTSLDTGQLLEFGSNSVHENTNAFSF